MHSPYRATVFFHGRRRREPTEAELSISIRIQKRVYVHEAAAMGPGASGSPESRGTGRRGEAGRHAGPPPPIRGGAGPGCRPAVAPLGDAREA